MKSLTFKRLYSFLPPILISIYPAISLYAANPGEARFREILIPIAYLLSICIYLFGSTLFFVRNLDKTSILVSVFLIISYSYGHMYTALSDNFNFQPSHVYLVLLIGALYSLAAFLILRSKSPLHNPVTILNVFSVSLILISLLKISFIEYDQLNIKSPDEAEGEQKPLLLNSTNKSSLKRDVYHIVFDRYARQDILKKEYDFDNSEFIKFLEEKGFYVAKSSYANYPNTYKSLASTYNLDYIRNLGITKNDPKEAAKLSKLLTNFKLWKLFKSRGYRYFHFCPVDNNYADKSFNISQTQSNENLILYNIYRNSLLWSALSIFNMHLAITEELFDGIRLVKRERILYQLDMLKETANSDMPTFFLVHMLIPHNPYVFEADGSRVTFFEERRRSKKENYLNQLKFVNSVAMELIQYLLNTSSPKPIIIIQSDEGPYPENYAHNNVMNIPISALKQKYAILNAYYLPDVDMTDLYDDISPVNTFRIVFNLYFGTNYDLLPDKHYSYQFEDITHLFK